MSSGIVMNIQRFSLNDGPGIRTTVFLKGCNLRCQWCHNPESWEAAPQVLYDERKCVHCGCCETNGPQSCVRQAKVICGTEMTAQQAVSQALRDVRFYGKDGGVTFSGGEPLLQPAFVSACIQLLKSSGIHTCIETALNVSLDNLPASIFEADLIIADLKSIDAQVHRFISGAGNERILNNLRLLSERGIPMWIRMPLASGINTDESQLRRAARFLMGLSSVQQIDLLPVLNHAAEKYRSIGKEMTPFNTDIDSTELAHSVCAFLMKESGHALPLHCMV
ncbi:MAG: radical SAM protein [Clostridia bacterium]|nr:radical SAM protein [Clostridia bacterium]